MPVRSWGRRTNGSAGTAGRGAVRMGMVFAALITAASTVAAPAAVAAPRCTDIGVIFARGTDEPAGIGDVGQAFVKTLQPMVRGASLTSYPVQYPASWDFWKAAAGATDMSRQTQILATQCPETKIVLGGYSQGAAVVDVVATSPVAGLGYNAPLPAAVVPHIASIVVFGNPSARIGQPLTRMSPVFGSRTADLCNTNDPVCSLGRDFNAHVNYPRSGLVQLAAKWVTKHVQARV